MRITEVDGLSREQLLELARHTSAPLTDRIYALKLLREFESLFYPQFGANEKLQ